MNFGIFLMKSLTLLAIIILLALPFVAEYLIFRQQKKKNISHRRTRTLFYTLIYAFVATFFLAITEDTIRFVSTTSFAEWLEKHFSVNTNAQNAYGNRIFSVVICNLLVEGIFLFCGRIWNAGLSKQNIAVPANADGTFSKSQRYERKILSFFNRETWFFVGRITYYTSIALSCLYGLSFLFWLIPAFFQTDAWIPYNLMHALLLSCYLYPSVTLLVLWEFYFFIEGVKRINIECPELENPDSASAPAPSIDLFAIDNEIRTEFGCHYACDITINDSVLKEVSAGHGVISSLIGKAVSQDTRNPGTENESYLTCMDTITSTDSSIIINGTLFSPFSVYFLRYLSIVVARGDNVVLVCNSDAQIDSVYDFLYEGLSAIASPYCKNFQKDAVTYDDPIWKLAKVIGQEEHKDDASIEDKNILVTSLEYLCSPRFEEKYKHFIPMIGDVIFVDILTTLNSYHRQLAILNTRLKHLTKNIALSATNNNPSERFRIRYASRQVRYLCFDNTRMPGLDSVLKNMLAVDFRIVDAMVYNSETIIRCYNYEARTNETNATAAPQYFKSVEDIGAVVNLAVSCLSKGVAQVNIFAEDVIPYKDIAESIAANAGQVCVNANVNCIQFNRQQYTPSGATVAIVMDTGYNLPATIRKYASMMSHAPCLILVFSKPYLLRDYYVSRINDIWKSDQSERIPVGKGTKKDVSQRILIKASAGGISQSEVMYLAGFVPEFEAFVTANDINAILREVLQTYGTSLQTETDLFKSFEFFSSHEFNEQGKYVKEDKIFLRRKEKLFDVVTGRDMAILVTSGGEWTLPVPKSRISQKFIVGQNLMYNGNLYYIQKIDFTTGKIFAHLTVSSSSNEIYQYLQSREYRMEINPEQVSYLYPTKHVVMKTQNDDISVNEVFVSVFRAPMDVMTDKYYDIDPRTLSQKPGNTNYHNIAEPGQDQLAKQTYRRYGTMQNPGYSSESILKVANLTFSEKGALAMSVRIRGSFGADIKKTSALAAVMLNETLHAMFPSVADSISVCATNCTDAFDEKTRAVAIGLPRLTLLGNNDAFNAPDELQLLIIEDCANELGVVSILMSAGENVLKTLFSTVFQYLDWYINAEQKSNYLYFGLDHEPECFDFGALYKLSELLITDKSNASFADIAPPVQYGTCSFCSGRYPVSELNKLPDGRSICPVCASNPITADDEQLQAHLAEVKMFLENTYGIQIENDCQFCFEDASTIRQMAKQSNTPNPKEDGLPGEAFFDGQKTVFVEPNLPSANLSELLIRELTALWQRKNLENASPHLAKGHIALVIVQYLRFENHIALADARNSFYERAEGLFGEGYRQMVCELLEQTQFKNNPFCYMMSNFGKKTDSDAVVLPQKTVLEDKGLPYEPTQPDRVTTNEITYYYYTCLDKRQKVLYDALLAGIMQFREEVQIEGYSFDEICRISEAIRYDHPEIFWLAPLSVGGDTIYLSYDATQAEVQALQVRIEEAVSSYLAEINETMSAYEVALHFHIKLIQSTDYDTAKLRTEKPDEPGIDYIRTICGLFLNGKAVCAGYAKAFQYLLQKCGIECAMVAGHSKGEGHAWNLVKIDGEYYYIDTTWDDSSNTIQKVKNTLIGFDHFCITSEEISRAHTPDLTPFPLPQTTATKANYYYHNGLVIDRYDIEKLKGFARTAAERQNPAVTFKCTTEALFREASKKLFGQDNRDCFLLINEAHKINPKIDVTSCPNMREDETLTITIRFKMK